MVYRKSLDNKRRCSWNCGSKHDDFAKATEHENKSMAEKEGIAYE